MSPVANDRPIANAPQPRRADRAAEPEQRTRFEDALSRREPKQEGKQTLREATTPDPAQLGHLPHHGFDLMHGGGGGGQRDHNAREQDLAMLDGLRPTAIPAAAPPPVEAPAPTAGTQTLAPTHAEFTARLDLPSQPTGSEFQLSMSDTRWLATHAVVARDNAGGLSLDLTSQGDGDAEQQRAELRARLEARGHRVDRIDFAG